MTSDVPKPHQGLRVQAFQVGEWTVDPLLNSVFQGTQNTRLEPKTMQVLVCLAERAGEGVALLLQRLDEVGDEDLVLALRVGDQEVLALEAGVLAGDLAGGAGQGQVAAQAAGARALHELDRLAVALLEEGQHAAGEPAPSGYETLFVSLAHDDAALEQTAAAFSAAIATIAAVE